MKLLPGSGRGRGASAAAAVGALLLLALGSAPAPARTAARTSLAAKPRIVETGELLSGLVSYGRWAAWSRYDATTHAYQLMVLDPSGAVRQLGVPETSKPAEVALGPLPSGEVGAVVSRCAEPGECALYELSLQSPVPDERLLPVPGGGSLRMPALWGNTVAFVRHVRRGRRTSEGLFEWHLGARHLSPLALADHRPAPGRCTGASCHEHDYGEVMSLSLQHGLLAYVTRTYEGWNEGLVAEVWVQRPGHRARVLEGMATGEDVGIRTFLSPRLSGDWLYSYRRFYEFGQLWVRYNLRTHAREQALVDFGDNAEGRVPQAVPLGDGVIFDVRTREGEPGESQLHEVQRINEEHGEPQFGTGTEILSLQSVKWAPGCAPRSMLEHGGSCKGS